MERTPIYEIAELMGLEVLNLLIDYQLAGGKDMHLSTHCLGFDKEGMVECVVRNMQKQGFRVMAVFSVQGEYESDELYALINDPTRARPSDMKLVYADDELLGQIERRRTTQ